MNIAPGLIVDCFAGGGGASTGIEEAIGRPIDIAINHDEQAIAMHKANHPDTQHYCQSISAIDPLDAVRTGGPNSRNAGQQIALAWFSPDCKHFSKALGGKPRDKNIRDLAWIVIHWIERLKKYNLHPRIIMLENVEEFRTWAPLLVNGKPCPKRKGETFNLWIKQLKKHGYKVEFKLLKACDYGAPTIRKRLFMIARRDGHDIIWPKPSHGPDTETPYRTAADIIDWSIPCPSIFARKRPLKDTTCRRIANGLARFVINAETPFIVPITHTKSDLKPRDINKPLSTITTAKGGEFALAVPKLVTAFMAQHNGGPKNNNIAGHPADKPLSTITGRGTQQQIVTSNLIKFQKNQAGKAVDAPLDTILASGLHHAEVRAFLIKYYGNEKGGHNLNSPIGTVTTKERFGLITVSIEGVDYVIVDIGMRMLSARELFSAMGFSKDYIIDPIVNGKRMTKTSCIARCGNAVCKDIPKALVNANLSTHNTQQGKAA